MFRAILLIWLGMLICTPQTRADLSTNLAPAAQAQQAFNDTRALYKKEPRSAEAAWQFARACFDKAEFATNSAERAKLAELGIDACQQLINRQSNSTPAHYYLAMNVGQLARTRGLGALKLVKEMQREFTIARGLDEHFDYAGPDRNLGLLYRDAPALGSIGSRTKARQHLASAIEIAPKYPENRLNLIEACLKWNDRNGARRELKALEEALPQARAKFAGATWAASWTDWEQRLKTAKKKLEETPRTIETPRQKDLFSIIRWPFYG